MRKSAMLAIMLLAAMTLLFVAPPLVGAQTGSEGGDLEGYVPPQPACDQDGAIRCLYDLQACVKVADDRHKKCGESEECDNSYEQRLSNCWKQYHLCLQVNGCEVVPEPVTLALAAGGFAIVAGYLRRRKQ